MTTSIATEEQLQLKIRNSLDSVAKWVEDRNYRGYEPFDGLSSFFQPLTFDVLLLDRILQQIVRQSPINLRPLMGVPPLESTKGRGYMAWGYLTMYKVTREESYRQRAETCLQWLIDNKSPLYPDFSWANHYDFAGRSGKYHKHESIIVWTSLVGQAFLDAAELLGNEKYLDVANNTADWILKLPREKTESGNCLSYLMKGQKSIHNANMLGAGFLARVAAVSGRNELQEVAYQAMLYSCSRQLEDGSWYYAEADNMHWIDNFHTGYNLDSLKCYIDCSGDETFAEQLRKGFQYYKTHFIEENGRPKYYHNRAYPIDSQCASQSIETLANFAEYDSDSLPLAIKVANWTIDNMQDKKGYFYYRQYPRIKSKTPMLHWAQATTFKGLALLYEKLQS